MVTLFDTYSQDTVFKLQYHHPWNDLGQVTHGKLSRMTHSYRANISSVSTLDGRGADTAVCKKKKTIETGCI